MQPDSEACAIVTHTSSPCYVYKVPPARSHAGHRAQDWDVEKWLQEVRLRVVEQGDRCTVFLDDITTGNLFAACPLPIGKPVVTAVEPVLDSSRYFVMRVEDITGEVKICKGEPVHAFVGLGFGIRGQAYDFQAALQDYERRMDRQREADRRRAEGASAPQHEEESGTDCRARKHDFSLKEGQTIHLNLKPANRDQDKVSTRSTPASSGWRDSNASIQSPGSTTVLKTPSLAPPPSVGVKQSMALTPPPAAGDLSKARSEDFGSASSLVTSGGSTPHSSISSTGQVVPEANSKVTTYGELDGNDDDDFGDFVTA